MAIRRVNPNRMELLRLKNQLRTARRGHKLLKDKRDELMRQFLILLRETEEVRRGTEAALFALGRGMSLATAVMTEESIATALLSGRDDLELELKDARVMSVHTIEFSLPEGSEATQPRLPYALNSSSAELDEVILALQEALPLLIRLAGLEKRTEVMAREIEVTRRRVNSLEYRMIPDLEGTIRSISMKMDENERGNLTRLMKVKEMILEEDLARKRHLAEERL